MKNKHNDVQRPRIASSARSNEHIRRALAFERAQLLRSRSKARAEKSGRRKMSLTESKINPKREGGPCGTSSAEQIESNELLVASTNASLDWEQQGRNRPSTSGGRKQSEGESNNDNASEFTKWLAATVSYMHLIVNLDAICLDNFW